MKSLIKESVSNKILEAGSKQNLNLNSKVNFRFGLALVMKFAEEKRVDNTNSSGFSKLHLNFKDFGRFLKSKEDWSNLNTDRAFIERLEEELKKDYDESLFFNKKRWGANFFEVLKKTRERGTISISQLFHVLPLLMEAKHSLFIPKSDKSVEFKADEGDIVNLNLVLLGFTMYEKYYWKDKQERRYISLDLPKEKNRTTQGRGGIINKGGSPFEVRGGDEFFVKAKVEKNNINKNQQMFTTIEVINKYVAPDEKPKMKVRY